MSVTAVSADDPDFGYLSWAYRALGLDTGKRRVMCTNYDCRSRRRRIYSRYSYCPYCGCQLEEGLTLAESDRVSEIEAECKRRKREAMITQFGGRP